MKGLGKDLKRVGLGFKFDPTLFRQNPYCRKIYWVLWYIELGSSQSTHLQSVGSFWEARLRRAALVDNLRRTRHFSLSSQSHSLSL